jgi:hypothetical protein
VLDICESRNVEESFIVNVGSPVRSGNGGFNGIATADTIDLIREVNFVGKDAGGIDQIECSYVSP